MKKKTYSQIKDDILLETKLLNHSMIQGDIQELLDSRERLSYLITEALKLKQIARVESFDDESN